LWAFVDTFRIFGLMVLCCLPLILLFKRVKRAPVRQVESVFENGGVGHLG
jgi:hypothetical protein